MSHFKVQMAGDQLAISPPYHAEELKLIGARFKKGVWLLPAYNSSLQSLVRLLGQEILQVTPQVANLAKGYGFPIHPNKTFLIERHSVWNYAHEYQKELVRFLHSTPHPGALINLSPGLGKTFSTILAAHNFEKPVLILAPLTFLAGWREEILSALPDAEVHLCHQRPFYLHTTDQRPTWVVANYDTVVTQPEWFTPVDWSVMIIDESVNVKNRQTQRVHALRKVRESVERVWLLSGSPVTRYADDLWAQLNLIDPSAFTAYWRFAREYCNIQRTPWGDKVSGNKRAIDLRKEFRDLIFTVREHEVISSTPDRFEIIKAPLAQKQRELFDQMNQDLIAELESTTVEAALTISKLAYLQQIVSNPVNLDEEWTEWPSKAHSLINALNRKQIPTPTIVWTWFVDTSAWLEIKLRSLNFRVGRIHSGLSASVRAQIVTDFQAGHLDVLLLGLAIGKYGLTLNNAESMVYYERTWDADAYIQSLARMSGGLRGVGRQQKEIFILHSPDTTDDLIEKNLRKKAFSITQVSQQDLLTLLKGFRKHGE